MAGSWCVTQMGTHKTRNVSLHAWHHSYFVKLFTAIAFAQFNIMQFIAASWFAACTKMALHVIGTRLYIICSKIPLIHVSSLAVINCVQSSELTVLSPFPLCPWHKTCLAWMISSKNFQTSNGSGYAQNIKHRDQDDRMHV